MSQSEESASSVESQARAAELGGQPALIQQFGIRGLYGYRTIFLSSQYAATILIAKNGTGKTTLIGTLDAFLKLQLYRLRELDFKEIFCRFRDGGEELVLSHDDLISFLQVPSEGEIVKISSRAGIEPERLFQFLLTDYNSALDGWIDDYDPNSVTNVVVRAFSNVTAARKVCTEAYLSIFARSVTLSNLRAAIERALSDRDIVYLPTYRRVERSINEEKESRRPRGMKRPPFSFATDGLQMGDIKFGLKDISERLLKLNTDIVTESNIGYREISENIINEMVRGFEVSEDTVIPKPDDLKLFFARLESGKRVVGRYHTISAPDFERIYSGEGVPPESRKFLTYFLGKLNNIIEVTKSIERPVDEFVDSCNRYLSSLEPSTLIGLEATHRHLRPVDGKSLRLDRSDLSVHVESTRAKTEIPLEALSSGEKQMVSLFARLYLYPRKKIVLIDEPELSLSIDWQKNILVDVLLSSNCEQVIAITHSPFVFNNSLEPFARSLGLEVEVSAEPELDLNGSDSIGDTRS